MAAGIPGREVAQGVFSINMTRSSNRYRDGACFVSSDFIPAIVRGLCAVFGVIEIDGWRITCDPDGPAILTSKAIPGREIEITEPKSGQFEYLQPEWREVYDDFDFATYFSGLLMHCRRSRVKNKKYHGESFIF